MKKVFSFFIVLFFISIAQAQNVGIGTTTPAASAQLDVNSTTKGFLPPRMTYAQRNSIVNPAVGLVVYCTDCDELQVFNGTIWKNMSGSAAVLPSLPNVNICNQSWMTKNLDVTSYRNGDPIPQVTDPSVWTSLTTGAWCYYNNDPANGSVYGNLYNWYAVNDPRGLAPQGWHIPSNAEWATLVSCLGGDVMAGAAMKETGLSHWISPNTGATNSSGFNGLPGASRYWADGSWFGIGNFGYWWTNDNHDPVPIRHLKYNSAGLLGETSPKTGGFAVRCLKDGALPIQHYTGEIYGGGIVFFISDNGQHGLIAAPSDQGTAGWGCYGTAIIGADGTAIGTGSQNTIDIMTGCSTAGIAAKICGDLVLNGYSDWYLPSKDELNELYRNKAVVGGFANFYYWSSSEYSNFVAWYQYFSDGDQNPFYKDNMHYVRAVRAF